MTEKVIFPYSFVKKIGEGGFGKIYQVKNKISDKSYACKLVKNNTSYNEIGFMLKLKNEENIINLHECYHIPPNRLAIVMEQCSGPNIYDAIKLIGDHDERTHYKKRYVLQSISAVKACHDHSIIHKDIKHTNFILKDTNKDSTVKLIDFGLSEYDFGCVPCKMCGTLRYMPPEGFVFSNSYTSNDAYLTKAYDIWSLGVMIYLLYTGIDVFRSPDEKVVVNNIRKGIVHNSLNHRNIKNTRLSHLLRKMMRVQPMMRPTIEEVYAEFHETT